MVCWGALVQLDSSTVLSRDVTSLKNAEWGPESNEAMINEIYDRPCRLGCTMGALTDATPKDGISRVFLEEKIFETWYHNRTVLIGDGESTKRFASMRRVILLLLTAAYPESW